MLEDDMISTFLKTLGLTYQLMLFIASIGNFSEVINKATCIQLAIRVGLIIEVATVPPNTRWTVTIKVDITFPESNIIQAIEIPQFA